MGRQRFTPEQIIAKLREVEVLVGRELPGGLALQHEFEFATGQDALQEILVLPYLVDEAFGELLHLALADGVFPRVLAEQGAQAGRYVTGLVVDVLGIGEDGVDRA